MAGLKRELKDLNSLFTPVVCKSIHEVVCFEHRWEVIDLNHMAKLNRVDTHVLINRVVIVYMLNGNSHRLFQMCLDLTGQTQYYGLKLQKNVMACISLSL